VSSRTSSFASTCFETAWTSIASAWALVRVDSAAGGGKERVWFPESTVEATALSCFFVFFVLERRVDWPGTGACVDGIGAIVMFDEDEDDALVVAGRARDLGAKLRV
jgi:hypothetical protein